MQAFKNHKTIFLTPRVCFSIFSVLWLETATILVSAGGGLLANS
jgi:hypothetical protein